MDGFQPLTSLFSSLSFYSSDVPPSLIHKDGTFYKVCSLEISFSWEMLPFIDDISCAQLPCSQGLTLDKHPTPLVENWQQEPPSPLLWKRDFSGEMHLTLPNRLWCFYLCTKGRKRPYKLLKLWDTEKWKRFCPASVPLRSPNNGPNVTSAQTGARECFSEGLNADGFLNHNGEEHASDTIWILNLISDFYFIASKVKLRKQHVQSSC